MTHRSEAPIPQGTLLIASHGTARLKDKSGGLEGAPSKLAAKLTGTVLVAKAFVYSSLFMTCNSKSALLAVKIYSVYSYRIQTKKKDKCAKTSLKIQIFLGIHYIYIYIYIWFCPVPFRAS